MFSFMDNRRGKIVSLKNVFLFLLFSLFFTPSFTFASAAEKWEILENTYDTAKKTIHLETRKISTDAANSGRYVVDVPVNPSDLGKTVKSMLWAGLAVGAVTGLVEGIGWVIDYGSKVIKKEVPDPNNSEKLYRDYNGLLHTSLKSLADSISGPNGSSYAKVMPDGVSIGGYRKSDNGFVGYWGSVVNNPNYDPTKKQYVYMDDAQLGNEIMGQGQNSVPDPTAITSAYNPNNPLVGEPAPAASNDALDSANPQPESDPFANVRPTPNVDTNADGLNDAFDPSAPSLGEEIVFPNFCEWAPAVCDFFGWVKEKPNLTPETELPVPVTEIPNIPMNADTFQATAGCPAPLTAPINFGGQSSTLQISYEPICQFAEKWSFVSPLIGFLSAAMIVVGVGRKGDEQSV